MKPLHKTFLIKYLPFLPLIVSLLLDGTVFLCSQFHLVLRSTPATWLFWLNVLSGILLLVYLAIAIYRWGKQKPQKSYRILAPVIRTLLVLSCYALGAFALFVYAFSHQPEHVVERNHHKMVACVNSFTDVFVTYYEYKGNLFRGDFCLGEEWYGSGGYDPFTTEMEVTPKRSSFIEK